MLQSLLAHGHLICILLTEDAQQLPCREALCKENKTFGKSGIIYEHRDPPLPQTEQRNNFLPQNHSLHLKKRRIIEKGPV